MSLEDYCRREGIDSIWDRLKSWYVALDDEWVSRLIRRNMDREFDLRQDLDSDVKREFLEALAQEWTGLERDKHPRIEKSYRELERPHPLQFSPPNVMTRVIQAKPRDFLLRGGTVGRRSAFLFRYVELHRFVDNLDLATISLNRESGIADLARRIEHGEITGHHVEVLSWPPGRPVWCTDDSLASETRANIVRDQLGLQHVDGHFLLEIRYPYTLLTEQGLTLQAPTILDASGGRGDNWIFIKSKEPGGPNWGYTVDMSVEEGHKGVPEAVHPLPSPSADPGSLFKLRVVGEPSGPQRMKGALMLANEGL